MNIIIANTKDEISKKKGEKQMDTTNKNNKIEKTNKELEFFNDQIGENASEEYKSENYDNQTIKSESKNKWSK